MGLAGGLFAAILACVQTEPPILWEFFGSQPSSGFGTSVAGIGDLDGDGFGDVGVGAPYFDTPTQTDAGQVVVFSGATGASMYTFVGSPPNSLGAIVPSPGDLDGDGVPEILAFVPVLVFSGADGSRLLNLPPALPRGAGDVNGDGAPDLLRAIPWGTPTYPSGFVEVHSGVDGTLLMTLTPSGLTPGCGSAFGLATASLDVDGDGVSDLVIGAPGGPLSPPSVVGCVTAFSGANGSVLWTSTSQQYLELFGARLAVMGDLDGDGVSEVVASAHGWDASSTSPNVDNGKVRVLSGATGSVVAQWTWLPGQKVGNALAAPGDIDGDGYEEVVAYAFAGAVVFSTAPGAPSPLWAPLPGTNLQVCVGPSCSLGSVGAAGDVNADGFPDVLVGSPGDYVNGTIPGWARVISGAPLGVSTFGTGCSGSGGSAPPRVGARVKAQTGADFLLFLSRAPLGVPALLILGFSNADWAGAPLPLDLGFLGLPGCSLLVAPHHLLGATTSFTPSGGAAEVALPIPANPSLVGGRFFAQWWVAGPAPSPLPGSMTRGIGAQIH